jgi:hypothetical protein
MSEASLPFNEKFYPATEKITDGTKLKQEWEDSIKNPREFWGRE